MSGNVLKALFAQYKDYSLVKLLKTVYPDPSGPNEVQASCLYLYTS